MVVHTFHSFSSLKSRKAILARNPNPQNHLPSRISGLPLKLIGSAIASTLLLWVY